MQPVNIPPPGILASKLTLKDQAVLWWSSILKLNVSKPSSIVLALGQHKVGFAPDVVILALAIRKDPSSATRFNPVVKITQCRPVIFFNSRAYSLRPLFCPSE
jgi:hypothetical protein